DGTEKGGSESCAGDFRIAPSPFFGGILARGVRTFVGAPTPARRQTGGTDHRRFVRHAASIRSQASARYGNRSRQGAGGKTEGADLRIERELARGQHATRDG